MKYRTRNESYTVPHTVAGITVDVVKQRQTSQPVLPRDWDRAALRTVTGLVLTLTTVAVVWSTVSIGNVLGGGVGYLAATVFDAAWATCLLLEWMARFSPAKRTFPRGLGWLLLLITMGAIFWNGLLAHSIAMAVVGAFVSFAAKVLWLGVTKHVDKELSDADSQWVAAQISAANAAMAVGQVRRQAARIEHQAVAELLAMEAETSTAGLLLGQPEMPEPVYSGPSPTVRAAVRAAHATLPDATPDELVEQLARIGVDVTAEQIEELTEPHRNQQQNQVPEPAPSAERNQFGTNVNGRTELLRNLIAAGTTDTTELRNQVEEAGYAAPSPEYVRRLIRDARG